MTPNQFQLAISQCIQQALQSGQTPPPIVIAILECAKLDIHAHMVKAQENSAIIPMNRMPDKPGGVG